ncbi:transcriptional regulator with XRE-family HTH domain [Mucilaginibacter sp. SG564]|nr:transcriptional regulator with XRE-family HTH domain [Mucilaginibacter sp. SG564]
MITFGSRLTSIRKERKVLQSDLGIKAGVHRLLVRLLMT